MLIYGLNPVLEAIRAGRAVAVAVTERPAGRVLDVVKLAEERGVAVRRVSTEVLHHMTGGRAHQGVAAEVEGLPEHTVSELVREAAGIPLILVLDGIEDPQNLGAILRTADAAGVDGIVRQTRHAARLGPAAAKSSAGAIAHVRIAPVVNIARALEELKGAGVWTVGLASDAERLYTEMDFSGPTALVVGAEGTGLRRLVRERCDWLAAIPMAGRVGSLNVSVAAGVALFEVVRQRGHAARTGKSS
jgi:23S rRNA (guanosine2251-2'-O)-methyltransferase